MFVARYGFLLRHVVPDDLAIGMRVVEEFLVPTASCNALELTLVFLAHTLKWPPAVQQWLRVLKAQPPKSATQIALLYRQVILFCNGKRWPRMHAAMTSGRAGASTGVAVAGMDMGFLLSDKLLKKGSATPVAGSSAQKHGAGLSALTVTLGATATSYTLLPDVQEPVAVIQNILDAAETTVRF